MRYVKILLGVVGLVAISAVFFVWRAPPKEKAQIPSEKISNAMENLPLYFEENQGQSDSQVKFLSHGKGYGLFFSPQEIDLSFKDSSLKMKLLKSNESPKIVGMDSLPSYSNYFQGQDPKKWKTNIPHFAKVKYEEVYSGIDLIFHGTRKQMEYDFVVKPGADPKQIDISFSGASKVLINEVGDLVLKIGRSKLIQKKPIVYQMNNDRKEILVGN